MQKIYSTINTSHHNLFTTSQEKLSPAVVNIISNIGKRAFYEQAKKPLDEAYQYASQIMLKNMLKTLISLSTKSLLSGAINSGSTI